MVLVAQETDVLLVMQAKQEAIYGRLCVCACMRTLHKPSHHYVNSDGHSLTINNLIEMST